MFAPDLKGFGENADMEYPYSLSDYVAEVEEYIKANKLIKPHVIAHSFGARVALKAAAKDKDLFDWCSDLPFFSAGVTQHCTACIISSHLSRVP